MTVTATTTYSELVGNGSATAFPFTFAAASADEVKVSIGGVVQSGGYTVALSSSGTGGTVTFDTAPANAAAVLIESDPDFTMETAFANEGSFNPATFDRVHDRLTAYTLWLKARVSMLFPFSFSEASARAGKFLGFDAGGVGVLLSGTGADGALRTDMAASGGSALAGFLQSGTGAVARTSQAKLRERVSVFDYNAKGDAVLNTGTGAITSGTDDTAAFEAAIAALAPGGKLEFGNGNDFKISRTLFLTKPIRIDEAAMKLNRLIFSKTGTYQAVGDGTNAAIIIPHTNTAIAGHLGDGRHSNLHGFTIVAETPAPANLRGIVICAPSYLDMIWAQKFSSSGFAIMAGAGSPIAGIANATRLANCIAFQNGGDGFYLEGNDANACLLDLCFAAENTGWGFNDESLIGNVYLAPQVDSNIAGGYRCSQATARSSYYGPYAESGQTYSLSAKCRVGDPLGDVTGISANAVFSISTGEEYHNRALVWADSDTIAAVAGAAPSAGKFMRVDHNGINYRATASGYRLQLNGALSASYTSFAWNGVAVVSFANSAVTGNIDPTRAYFPGGAIFGASGKSGIVGAGTAAPTTGAYVAGAIFLNDAPAAGGKVGWICVAAGSPGTWKPFGAIDA